MATNQTKDDESLNNVASPSTSVPIHGTPPPAYSCSPDMLDQNYGSPYPAAHYFHSTDAVQFGLSSAASVPNLFMVTQSQQPANQEFYTCHIFWSCFTFWMCWGLFGGIAFLLAGEEPICEFYSPKPIRCLHHGL
jgi:hypothetical protein